MATKVDGEGRLNLLFEIMSTELRNAQKNQSEEAVAYACGRFAERLRKRGRLGSKGLRELALEKFLEINERVRNINLGLDPTVEHIAKTFIAESFERYNTVHDRELIQVSYDYRHLLRFWRFGPGTSYGVEGTHTAEKLAQPMTVTPAAKSLVSSLRNTNFYLRAHDLRPDTEAIRVVRGSRMTTVPKNETTERTIEIGPSGNMALQLALGEYISDVLRSIGLDIRTQQPLNKALAHRGSLDGSLATIDMSSASDMFSIQLVKRLMPEGVFDTMLRLRTSITELPDGRECTLAMMSCMGNGFTFPMMTMIFVALVYANSVMLGTARKNRWINWAKCGVFGDDIIVPTDEAPSLIQILESCGFVVNHDKTYLEGPFRESCGGDYWNGYDVTPVYVKSVSRDPEVYVAINGIMEWSARHHVLLPKTMELLRSFIDGEVCFVPEWHGNDSGFRTTTVPRRYSAYQVVSRKVRLGNSSEFAMMLACGGYVRSEQPWSLLRKLTREGTLKRGSELARLEKQTADLGETCGFYTPRPFKTRYKRKSFKMPAGFLSGRDRHSRSDEVSRYVESYAFIFMM